MMMRVQKLLFALAMVLGMTPTSYAQSGSGQNEGEDTWSEALALGFEIEADLNEFLSSLGAGSGEGDWRTNPGVTFESDDHVLRLVQHISVLQRQSRELAQRAVDLRPVNFFGAKMAKHSACLTSGKAKLKAEGGIVLTRTDLTLSRPQEFEGRFLSINQKLARFRALLGCLIQ